MNSLLPLKTGKNRTSSRRRACRSLRLEPLEHRRLMTGVTYDPLSGIVTIEGGDYNDCAKCTWNEQTQQLTVDWGIGEPAKPAVPQHKVISGPVKLIVFKGHGGDDKFTSDTPIVCDVDGGAGNDTLIGGSASDDIHGGKGHDKFFEYYGLNGTEHEKVLDYKAGEDTMLLAPDPLYYAPWWQQNGAKDYSFNASLAALTQ